MLPPPKYIKSVHTRKQEELRQPTQQIKMRPLLSPRLTHSLVVPRFLAGCTQCTRLPLPHHAVGDLSLGAVDLSLVELAAHRLAPPIDSRTSPERVVWGVQQKHRQQAYKPDTRWSFPRQQQVISSPTPKHVVPLSCPLQYLREWEPDADSLFHLHTTNIHLFTVSTVLLVRVRGTKMK